MYYWSFYMDQELEGSFGETIEECINEARAIIEADNLNDEFIFIGKFEKYKPCIDIDEIITELQERAYDKFGESADGWLEDIKLEHVKELENRFNSTFKIWLDKNKYKPTFGVIFDFLKYNLETGLKVLEG